MIKKLLLLTIFTPVFSCLAMNDAVQRRDYAQIKTLLAQRVSIEGEENGISPLRLAIEGGDKAMVAFLMGQGARLYPFDPMERDAVTCALETGNKDMITLVTPKNAELCKEIFRNGRTIQEALEYRDQFGTW